MRGRKVGGICRGRICRGSEGSGYEVREVGEMREGKVGKLRVGK